VLSDDGGLLACAINAVCAALVDAAVPLRTLCAAVAVAQAPGHLGRPSGIAGVTTPGFVPPGQPMLTSA
jgi:exosome complex RNA-binding protein Rrp42 (RNase PH superfamily)